MENSKIVIKYIKSKNASFNGRTDQDIVKWFANSIKQTELHKRKETAARKLQSVTRKTVLPRVSSRKQTAARKLQSATRKTILSRAYKNKQNTRTLAFSLLPVNNRTRRRKISEISRQNHFFAKQAELNVQERIQKVQRPLYLRFKDFMNFFYETIKKNIDIKFMKQYNDYYDYESDFKVLFAEMLTHIFNLYELEFYVSGVGISRLFDEFWENINNKSKVNNIIRKEEHVLYAKTTNLYLNITNNLNRNWINNIYSKGRETNISKISTEDKKLIENKVKQFAHNINANKRIHAMQENNSNW